MSIKDDTVEPSLHTAGMQVSIGAFSSVKELVVVEEPKEQTDRGCDPCFEGPQLQESFVQAVPEEAEMQCQTSIVTPPSVHSIKLSVKSEKPEEQEPADQSEENLKTEFNTERKSSVNEDEMIVKDWKYSRVYKMILEMKNLPQKGRIMK